MQTQFSKYCLLLSISSAFLWASCANEEKYIPRPRGYHRIEFPEHQYQKISSEFPYQFEYSAHAKIIPDRTFMSEPYWIELYYPDFKASVHISYKPIQKDRKKLEEYINDSYKLASKHNVKAYAIEEMVSTTKEGYRLTFYELEGDVPTTFQYTIDDSLHHFFRASLYFPTSEKNDSLAPVIHYVKQDMMQMLKTFDWKKDFKPLSPKEWEEKAAQFSK